MSDIRTVGMEGCRHSLPCLNVMPYLCKHDHTYTYCPLHGDANKGFHRLTGQQDIQSSTSQMKGPPVRLVVYGREAEEERVIVAETICMTLYNC